MKPSQPTQTATRTNVLATRPQMVVRSNVRAGLNDACALGVSYWRKEMNRLKEIADALDCR